MSRPMMFSAAHSALFEQARQQSQERVQPQFLWKRGFHSEGGIAGWGYYLEPAPSEVPSTIDEEQEDAEGSAAGKDVEYDGHEEHRRVGHAGARKRPNSQDRNTDYPTSRTQVIASHGVSVSICLFPPTLIYPLPARRIARRVQERWLEMAVKTHALISLWFALTIPVIFWDAGYCFFRPRSMVGGDLHWIWKPYAIYQEVDYVYGVKSFQNGDGFTNAQSALNIVENLMNIGYLYLAHVVGSPAAPLLGFASAIMTLSKTVLYWLQEYYCGGCAVGHNDLKTLIVYWIIPNGFWLLVPSYIVWQFGKDISTALRVAGKASAKTKKQ